MPRRSNAFQKLITLVHKQLAEHAHVVESPFLADAVTGKSREVDVLIEASIAGYVTRLAVECIDWKRKADVTWLEKMFLKHQSLPTGKLILVSRSDFLMLQSIKHNFSTLQRLLWRTQLNRIGCIKFSL